MKVRLINYSSYPEQIVACAAKLCYSNSSIEDVSKKMNDDSASKLVGMLSEIGHESPIEHAFFTFGIEGVSRSLLAQITRHRMASFSVQSQRYVNEDNFQFVVPPEIEKNIESKRLFLEAMKKDLEYYNKITSILKEKYKKGLIQSGVEDSLADQQAEKRSIEDARFVLPNACATKMIMTLNARSLMNFFRLRCCNRAQWEINELACKMLSLVGEVAPSLFKNAGPACINGKCTEGKMSCKKMDQVRKKIANIKLQKR